MKKTCRDSNFIIIGKITLLLCAGIAIISLGLITNASKDNGVDFDYIVSLMNKENYNAVFLIEQLEVDGIKEPFGVDNKNPVFSWQIKSEKQNIKQHSYQIIVCKQGLLENERTVVWDSGKVVSSQSNAIPYMGEALKETCDYLWIVVAEDINGEIAISAWTKFTTSYWQENIFSNTEFIAMQPEEKVYEDGQPIFRKSFNVLKKEVKRAVLYSSALGLYDAYLNGERIGRLDATGGTRIYDELKPGWTNYDKTLLYNTYDVTSYLKKGVENKIGIMLGTGWWCGRVSQGTYGYLPPAFIGELHILYSDGTKERIVTDETWDYIKDTSVISADIYNGEVFNANLPTASDETMELSKKGGCKVRILNKEDTSFNGEFRSFYGYNVTQADVYCRSAEEAVLYNEIEKNQTDFGQIAVQQVLENEAIFPLALSKGQTVIFDFGQNMTGVPNLVYTAPEESTITMEFGEVLNDSGSKNRKNDGPKGSIHQENYRSAQSKVTIVSGGEDSEEYQTVFSYFGFRYIAVCASEDIVIQNLTGIALTNTSPESGDIWTDNRQINQLFSNIKWSQRNNFLLVASDCPQRDERLGWTGDLQVFQRASLYNQDLRTFYNKWLQDCLDSQQDDGAYTDTVPFSIVTGSGNAGWADAGISIPYYLYKFYGDKTGISKMYDSMSRYMDYLDSVSNFDVAEGRIGPLTAFGDWLAYEETDKEFISTAYYAKNAAMMMDMAEILGNKKDTRKYKKKLKEVKRYFAKKYVVNNHLKVQTQTACLLALSNELITGKTKENTIQDLVKMIENNNNQLSTGFLGTPELLPVLSREGYAKLSYELLLKQESPSWMYSVNQGATTIWERWDSYTEETGFDPNGMNSFNHYSNGSIAGWMYESMLGISIDAANRQIILKPIVVTGENAPVKKCEGYYHSIYGKISVKWELDEDNLLYEVTIPANTEAVFMINEKDKKYLESGTYSFVCEVKQGKE